MGGCSCERAVFLVSFFEGKIHPEAQVLLRQLKTPGVSLPGDLPCGWAVLSHQGLESLLRPGLMSPAPDLLMAHCSLRNYSAQETCPRDPAQGNSRAGENAGNNKKDRVRLPVLGNGMVCHGHGAWGMENFILFMQVFPQTSKNTEKHKSKNYPQSQRLKLCLPMPLPRNDHDHGRL